MVCTLHFHVQALLVVLQPLQLRGMCTAVCVLPHTQQLTCMRHKSRVGSLARALCAGAVHRHDNDQPLGIYSCFTRARMHAGGLSFRATLLLANATPLAFLVVYYQLLLPPKRLPPGSTVLLQPGASQTHAAAPERGRVRAQGASRGEAAPLVGAATSGDGVSGEERSLVTAAATGIASAEPRRGGRGMGWRPPSVEDAAAEAAIERQRLLDGSSGSSNDKSGGGATLAAAGERPLRQSQRQEASAGGADNEGGGSDLEGWGSDSDGDDVAKASKAARMTWRERAARTAALWPYTVPLVVVYFAEYAMQAGTWTAIGEPLLR